MFKSILFLSAGILLCLAGFSGLFATVIFPRWIVGMPSASATFDCDDAVEMAYQKLQPWAGRFDRLEVTIVVGNLEKERETLEEVNHAWLLVYFRIIGGEKVLVVIDWGRIKLPSRQYLEGYIVGHEEIVRQMERDKDKKGEVAIGK